MALLYRGIWKNACSARGRVLLWYSKSRKQLYKFRFFRLSIPFWVLLISQVESRNETVRRQASSLFLTILVYCFHRYMQGTQSWIQAQSSRVKSVLWQTICSEMRLSFCIQNMALYLVVEHGSQFLIPPTGICSLFEHYNYPYQCLL